MKKVAIVTDSIACLPKELVEEYGITVVPINLIFEDRVYRDGVDITPLEFYKLLSRATKLPTTSPSSPGTFLEAYQKLIERASGILCITVSSKLSAVFDSARHAADGIESPIQVLDSSTAAGAEGFIVTEAARAAATGESLEKVREAAESMIPRVNFIAVMDTLYYLAKGGRIPKAAAWAGSILSVKPIIEVSGGEVHLFERVRTRRRALRRLLETMRERAGEKGLHVNLMHGDASEEAEKLKEEISSRFDCKELYVTEFTPVMGTHTGPGVLALAFYRDS